MMDDRNSDSSESDMSEAKVVITIPFRKENFATSWNAGPSTRQSDVAERNGSELATSLNPIHQLGNDAGWRSLEACQGIQGNASDSGSDGDIDTDTDTLSFKTAVDDSNSESDSESELCVSKPQHQFALAAADESSVKEPRALNGVARMAGDAERVFQLRFGVQMLNWPFSQVSTDLKKYSSAVDLLKASEGSPSSSRNVNSKTTYFDLPPIPDGLHLVKFLAVKFHDNDLLDIQIVEPEHCQQYENLVLLMESFYGMTAHEEQEYYMPESDVKMGMIVVLEAVEDDDHHVFRRGQITGKKRRNRKGKILWEVTCFDEAEVVEATHESLRYIEPSMMELPRQSFQCTLAGLEYVSGTGVVSSCFMKFKQTAHLRNEHLLANVTEKDDMMVLEIVHSDQESWITVNLEFEEYLYEDMTPEVVGDCYGRCVGVVDRALLAFQLSCPQTDVVKKLNPKFVPQLSLLAPDNITTIVDDGFVKHVYIHVTKRSKDAVFFERFVIEDIRYRTNEVLVELVDTPTPNHLILDIGSKSLYRADRIHKNLARWPSQYFISKISGLPKHVKSPEVYSYLKDKKLILSQAQPTEPPAGTELRIKVRVEEDLAKGVFGPANFMEVDEWAQKMYVAKLQKVFQ